MPIKSKAPASIEGSQIDISGQRIGTSLPPKRDPTGKVVFQVTVDRGSPRGEIAESLSPKRSWLDKTAMLNAGDGINGRQLWEVATKPFGKVTVGGRARTGKHPAQAHTMRGNCHLCIIEGWVPPPLVKHPRGVLLAGTA